MTISDEVSALRDMIAVLQQEKAVLVNDLYFSRMEVLKLQRELHATEAELRKWNTNIHDDGEDDTK